MVITNTNFTNFKLGSITLSDLEGAAFWLNPNRNVTLAVSNRISNIDSSVGTINMAQTVSASRPELEYRNSIPYIYNSGAKLLEGDNLTDLNFIHKGSDWSMYLLVDINITSNIVAYLFNNTAIAGGSTGFAIAVDHRPTTTPVGTRVNNLNIALFNGTSTIFTAACGADSFVQNSKQLIHITYTKTGTTNPALKVMIHSLADIDATSHTYNFTSSISSATINATSVPDNATSFIRLYKAAAGTPCSGYIGEIFAMNDTGKTSDNRLADQAICLAYFKSKYFN